MNFRRMMFAVLLLTAWVGCGVLPAGAADGTERILSYDSLIVIDPGGDVVVTETIEVRAAGDQIRRGIYRDFPTQYKDRRNRKVTVRFDVLEVLKDGNPEAYHTEKRSNGVRVYIGHKDRLLSPGVYTYTLTYRTDRQIGFFDDFDELYWNVTGNGWIFTIDQARARVKMPGGAEILQYAAYTGPFGADGKDYTAERRGSELVVVTTRPLSPGEGLTIAVAWPKGYVAPPGAAERLARQAADWLGITLAVIGCVTLLVYYYGTWSSVGRDPEKGTIIPRYAPPDGFSPAAVRFVMNMGFDKKSLAVALVNMAVKRFLTIEEDKKGVYHLKATGNPGASLSGGEAAVAAALFGSGKGTVALEDKNYQKIQAAMKALRGRLSAEYEKGYFLKNTRYFVPGLVLSLLVFAGVVLGADSVPTAFFMMVWLSGWSVGVYLLGTRVAAAWRSRKVVGALAATLFALPFFAGEIIGLGVLAVTVSLPGFAIFVGVLVVNGLFYHLLKAPTLAGRRLMDEIEGLRLYMTVAEKDRMNLLHPPERTPEHFEKLFPYAMALGVETAWGAQFADVLAKAAAEAASGTNVPLSWYSGRTPVTGLASHLGGSFAGAVSASSHAPGSSSGSGGGGSSGGGGGGGGGGGW